MPQTPENNFGFVPLSNQSAAPAPTPTPSPSDSFGFVPLQSQGDSSSTEPVSTPEQSAATQSSDQFGFTPLGGQPVQKTDTEPKPQEGFLHQTWDFLNKPLIEDLGAPAQIQGGSGVLGGIERGGYQVLSGLTSPLSLILTIGTLGTGGFLESAGANVLKDTLMAGADGLDEAAATEKVAQFEKAAKAAVNAFKTTGQPVSQAVEATGMPYNEFRALGSTLYDSGLTEKDLIGGNIVQRGLSSGFRNLGVDAVKAQKIAKGTQFLMDAGFTGQQVTSALHTVPQVFDALKDGDYKRAAEFATEGAVSGTLGLLGASHALHQAGETFGSINEIEKLRPSDENQKLNEMLGKREGAHQDANNTARNWEEATRKQSGAKLGFKKVFETKADEQAYHDKARKLLVALDTGNDPELARQTGNALAEAIGQPERMMPDVQEFAPGANAQLEHDVLSLGIKKPLEDISAKDIQNAGGSEDLQNKWMTHASELGDLSRKDQQGQYLVPDKLVSHNATFTTTPTTKFHASSVVLNPYAAELIDRVSEKTEDGRFPLRWDGLSLTGKSLDTLLNGLKQEAQSAPSDAKQGYEWAVQSIEKAKDKNNFVTLVKENGNFNNTLVHERTHTWINRHFNEIRQNPVSKQAASDFVQSGLSGRDPVISKAFKALNQMGYSSDPLVLFHEIGTFLAEGGDEFKKYGNMTQDEVNDLAKKYISIYNENQLKTFPSEHPIIQGALEANGHKGINEGASAPVFRKTTQGFGPFGDTSRSAGGGNGSTFLYNQHPGLPENIGELIAESKLNDKAKQYVSKFIDAYHGVAKGLTDKEKELYDTLRARDDQNWNEGNANGLISSHIENHIHRIWGDDTDVGSKLMQEARTGKFDTNVVQARKRVWNSLAEGLLRGRQLQQEDPIAIIGHDLQAIRKAAANREFLDNLRDNFTRASDGRPMVVLSGEGRAVSGPNGENSAIMVNNNRVRDIRIADNAVNSMRQTGDLDRFLNKGDIIDITPKVHPNNIDEWIQKFEERAQKQTPQYDPEGNNILRKNIEILKGVKDGTLPASALDEVNAQAKPQYVWHPQDYITPAKKSLHGWNWLAKTSDGTNILSQSDIKFHPEVAEYLANRLGLDKSYLREDKGIGKITKPLLTGGKEAKAVLLSFSPFHLQQEALRAIMMGVNPVKIDPMGEFADRPVIRKVAENGGTFAPDRNAIQEHSIGVAQHSQLLSKIPVLGKAMDWYQDFLFNRYIPSMKAQAAEVMFDKYKAAHPDWTDNAVAKATADHVNNAFGGQNWRAMGRAAATQDWLHLFTLAPDWLESEMRFAASTLRGGLGNKNFSRNQVLKMAAGLWGVARVANLVNSGNMHLEAPFGFVVKDKDGRDIVYSVRTLPTDILHMASDPAGFIKGRMSPFARLSEEALTQRDTFGRKLAPGDLAIDIARNMAPIPFQAIGQITAGNTPTVGNEGQFYKAIGFTSNVYRTEAEKLAAQLASQSDESGPIDPAKMQRYMALSRIEDGLRSGTVTNQELQDAHDFGGLSPDEYKKIRENLKLTHGLDPETARLVTHVARMPAANALQVWDAATPRERQALTQVMIKKKNSYMKKVMQSETPQQRLNDPVFRRIRLLFGQSAEETQQ